MIAMRAHINIADHEVESALWLPLTAHLLVFMPKAEEVKDLRDFSSWKFEKIFET